MDQLNDAIDFVVLLDEKSSMIHSDQRLRVFSADNPVKSSSPSRASLTEYPSIKSDSFVFDGLNHSFSDLEDVRTR